MNGIKESLPISSSIRDDTGEESMVFCGEAVDQDPVKEPSFLGHVLLVSVDIVIEHFLYVFLEFPQSSVLNHFSFSSSDYFAS